MRKKVVIMTTALLLTLGAATVLNGQDAQAAKKKVKATVKGKTLTISGKGAMSSKLKVKKSKQKKVKKIVVKKGVTSIPIGAFTKYKNVTSATVATSVKTIGEKAFNCKKLKKLTIPGKFKLKTTGGDEAGYAISGKVDTVTFNTNLQLARAAAFNASNLVVKKSDPLYKSVDGVIYSKDGKAIVRVPFQRQEITLAKDCEVFCLQSVLYYNPDIEGDPATTCQVKKITIPAGVKQVESDRYFSSVPDGRSGDRKDMAPGYWVDASLLPGLKVDVQSKQLGGQSLVELLNMLYMNIDDLMKQLPDQISLKDNMYITGDHLLLKYVGKDSTVTIPAGVKKIGVRAFYDNQKITKLVLPEGLTEIGYEAFSRCSQIFEKNPVPLQITFPSTLKKVDDGAFSSNVIRKLVLPATIGIYGRGVFESAGLEELVLPETMKVVPERLAESNILKKIVIPDSVQKIGHGAFQFNALEEIQLGKGLTEIADNAFYGNDLKQVTIPATVTKIGAGAFEASGTIKDFTGNITIQGTAAAFSDQAFGKSFILNFARGAKEAKTSAQIPIIRFFSKKIKADLEWAKVKGASGYEIVAGTNAKFTKNKKKFTAKASAAKKTITIKGKFKHSVKLYVKMRPYTTVDGKKVYGRWSRVA
jgi:hypothetical protein